MPKGTKYYDSLIFWTFRLLGYSSKNAAYLVCQAKWESGNYSSSLLQRANNLFGMRPATVRKTSRINDVTNNYAVYHNIIQSCYDRYLYDVDRGFDKLGDISIIEWNGILKQQGYYTANILEYSAGLGLYLTDVEDSIKKSTKSLVSWYFVRIVVLVLSLRLFKG